jgi:O-antigen/teichoic acid export membrane protein
VSEPKGSASAIRGGAVRVAGYASGVVVSLGTAAILVRHLGIESFGRYVIVTSLVALVGGLTEAGIVVYGIREFVVREEPQRRRLMENLLAMRLSLSIVGVALAVCFALVSGYREVIVLGTLVAGAGLLGQVLTDVLSLALQAQLLLARVTAFELVRRVLTLLFVAVLALAGAGLLPLLAAVPLATVLTLVLVAWMVRTQVAVRISFDWQIWRALFAETLPYAIALSIAAVYFYITVIMMSLIASATQTGVFATSLRVTQAALAIPALLLTAIFPVMVRAHAHREGASNPGAPDPGAPGTPGAGVGRVLTVAAICGVGLTLVMALGASFIIPLIAGSKGHAAIGVLRIQALVFIVSFISTASALTLVSLRRYRALVISSTGALLLNIVLALVLIPADGARGGALADVLTEAAAAVGLTLTVIRSVPAHEISARVLPPLLIAGGAALAVLALPIGALAHAVLASVIYLGALLLMGAIPSEVIAAARALRPPRTSS